LHSGHVSEVTVDATKALVSPCGALCTRIIGVREHTGMSEEASLGMRHYYIDDGCYGSLCNQSGEAKIPLPLLALNTDNTTKDMCLSTVWGPTCDGLDKVCHDLYLPQLQRDDWLVFPNIGAGSNEGMGTAFNGFDPPDTVYCALEYFK